MNEEDSGFSFGSTPKLRKDGCSELGDAVEVTGEPVSRNEAEQLGLNLDSCEGSCEAKAPINVLSMDHMPESGKKKDIQESFGSDAVKQRQRLRPPLTRTDIILHIVFAITLLVLGLVLAYFLFPSCYAFFHSFIPQSWSFIPPPPSLSREPRRNFGAGETHDPHDSRLLQDIGKLVAGQ